MAADDLKSRTGGDPDAASKPRSTRTNNGNTAGRTGKSFAGRYRLNEELSTCKLADASLFKFCIPPQYWPLRKLVGMVLKRLHPSEINIEHDETTKRFVASTTMRLPHRKNTPWVIVSTYVDNEVRTKRSFWKKYATAFPHCCPTSLSRSLCTQTLLRQENCLAAARKRIGRGGNDLHRPDVSWPSVRYFLRP